MLRIITITLLTFLWFKPSLLDTNHVLLMHVPRKSNSEGKHQKPWNGLCARRQAGRANNPLQEYEAQE